MLQALHQPVSECNLLIAELTSSDAETSDAAWAKLHTLCQRQEQLQAWHEKERAEEAALVAAQAPRKARNRKKKKRYGDDDW